MEYYSAKEYAQMNGVSARWVQELCKKGKIKGAKRITPTGAWLIPKSISNNSVVEKKEANVMVNAEKQMETAQMLLNNGDLDMSSVYFELAGEEYVRRGDFKNALLAYEKMLYCFETDEKPLARIEDVKKIIVSIKDKLEV